jgi:hypothetical protein
VFSWVDGERGPDDLVRQNLEQGYADWLDAVLVGSLTFDGGDPIAALFAAQSGANNVAGVPRVTGSAGDGIPSALRNLAVSTFVAPGPSGPCGDSAVHRISSVTQSKITLTGGRRNDRCLHKPNDGRRSKMATFKVPVPAGPLWNNDQAQKLGPAIAAAHLGTFTGQWSTVVEGEMSVVEVEFPTKPTGGTEYTMEVLAGPLWNDDDAKEKCPAICASYGGTWNGQWTTVVEGKMSVAGCIFKF